MKVRPAAPTIPTGTAAMADRFCHSMQRSQTGNYPAFKEDDLCETSYYVLSF